MPIRPENPFFYPIDWRELSNVIRFGRAKGCCEGCGRPHGQLVFHLGDGRWWDAAGSTWRSGRGRRLKLPPLECLSERPLPREVAGQIVVEPENAAFGFRPVYLSGRQRDGSRVWSSAQFITFTG